MMIIVLGYIKLGVREHSETIWSSYCKALSILLVVFFVHDKALDKTLVIINCTTQ